MKYHNWIKYGQNGMVIEIIVRDENNSKIEGFKVNSKDKKTLRKVLRTLNEKYGIDFPLKDSKKDKDLDWLK